jgi:GNAT superfamily N-acetyltransferase
MVPDNVTVRLATPPDAAEIAGLSRELIETGLGWSWTRARVARNIASSSTTTLVACDGERLIGFAIMYFGDEHAHLSLLAVRPAYQRAGVGRHLIEWLEDRVAAGSARHPSCAPQSQRPAVLPALTRRDRSRAGVLRRRRDGIRMATSARSTAPVLDWRRLPAAETAAQSPLWNPRCPLSMTRA